MNLHSLKIRPAYYEAVASRKKSFEIRYNDRDFQVGDMLLLQEFIPETEEYTGRVLFRKVTYMTDYAQKDNYVVMSIV